MYLVFDVGGTFIKFALMDKNGEIEETGKFPTQLDNTRGAELFVNSVFEIYAKHKDKKIEGIAMSLPGLIDVRNGFVHNGGALQFLAGMPLGKLLSEKCDNIPVALENDGKCAALCESWKGNASNVKDAYVLVLGTGVGGGMIIDHHVHHGNSLIAGEISYTLHNMERAQVETITPIETIGDVGRTVDTLPYIAGSCCSTLALRCKVAKYKGLSYHDVAGEDIFKWASEGDAGVQNILEDWYFTIAKLCVNIYVIFNPEIILIGGGISAQPLVLEGICRYVDKLKKISGMYKDISIGTCKYNNRSNLYGAMMNFNQLYNE